MYHDTVTLFNRHESKLGDMWFPTILRNCNLNIDKASIASTYGENSSDRAILNVKFSELDGQIYIAGKVYFPPKEWDNQVNDSLDRTITFSDGEDFDFFVLGEFPEEPIADNDYPDGFYDYMNHAKDYVFAITSVSQFSVIPHFEITGK